MNTKKKTGTTIELNRYAHDSAIIYAEALLEACKKAKVLDPMRALTDADEFPALLKISEVEYAIGWLNGCAETCGVTVTVLWAHVLGLIAKHTGPVKTPFRRQLDRKVGAA